MRVASLVAIAALMLSVPASAQEVTPDVLEEVRQMVLAAEKKAAKPTPEKTPEQLAAEKKATKSHCEAVFARATERNVKVPGSCE